MSKLLKELHLTYLNRLYQKESYKGDQPRMLYKKTRQVKEGDVVLCKVTKIFHSSVFADLLEYGTSGMIHISEIAPGRIRNLRDYVKEDKQIICVVLRINKERGHIDLSLRRVASNQQRQKLDEIKQELKAEQIITKLASEEKKKLFPFYKEISENILKEYTYLHEAFKLVAKEDLDLKDLNIDSALAKKLTEAVKQRFKEPLAVFKGVISLKSYAPAGVSDIKALLEQIQDLRSDLVIKYMGAGKYSFSFKDKNIKNAEKDLSKMEKVVQGFSDGKVTSSNFARQKAEMEEQ